VRLTPVFLSAEGKPTFDCARVAVYLFPMVPTGLGLLLRRSGRAASSVLYLLAVILALVASGGRLRAQAPPTTHLYEQGGVTPEAVRQGKLGSCYFHAVVAALAQSNPGTIKSMIRENSDGTYTVQFADGKKENAYPEDIRYSRQSGYDLSQGLWVAVLFRAYAQRVLRQSLAEAVDRTDMFALVKHYAQDLIASNDAVLIAYDRAIRAVVDQHGHIDRARLETSLKDQMKSISVPEDIKNSLVSMLDSGGFFAAIEETIKQNGEIFGAYRSVGQGGIAERVMEALGGSAELTENESENAAAALLGRDASAHRPMVACTGGSRYSKLHSQHQPLPANTAAWYVESHCYTVLGYGTEDRIVTLRNPWGDQPYPDGILKLPIASFVPAYLGVITTTR
jgi:hypothetical protein